MGLRLLCTELQKGQIIGPTVQSEENKVKATLSSLFQTSRDTALENLEFEVTARNRCLFSLHLILTDYKHRVDPKSGLKPGQKCLAFSLIISL